MVRYLLVKRKAFKVRKDVKPGRGVVLRTVRVPATTFRIRDRGARGRGPKLIKITRKGALTRLGYSVSHSAMSRHRALARAVDRYGANATWRMLHAQVIFRKRTGGAIMKFQADRNWVASTYGGPVPRAAIRKWKAMSHRERAAAMPG